MGAYITTTIPYVNARPHLGFALELVQADVLARHHRRRNKDESVRFQAGTDDNSLKNVLAAEAAGIGVQDFDFRRATSAVWAIADESNRYINRVRPWELAKAERAGDGGDAARLDGARLDGARLDGVLAGLVRACRTVGELLDPFLPDAAARITAQVTPQARPQLTARVTADASAAERLPRARPVFERLG
ncbi:class I tRNA ligase family protein [Actinomadura sp. KC216]|uniref:class I tRNA ligase family protein n=1 Tax=Actinomadura sp. KC216 TaxID=2530370 RepID=UPI001FB6EBC0|nr:class I tRNA ligase family protein [Actinomadura sp. KC216]